MDLLLRFVAIAATAVFLAATALMLLTFRRARRVTTASLLAPVLVSVAILLLYCVLLRATPSAGWAIASLVAGVVLGAIWARTHTLSRARDGAVRSRASVWYLGAWAGVLTLNQLVVLVADHASVVLVGLLVFSTGVAVGNGLSLLRRLRVLRAAALLALGLAASGALAGADDVLLLLPREFDVQAIRGWSRHRSEVRRFTAKELADEPHPFRFRGEDVTQESSRVDHHPGAECSVEIRYHHEYRARFRRGVLTGRWLTHQRNFNRGCKSADGEYMRVNHQGEVTGQADADGRLEVTVQIVHSECLDHGEGGWVRRDQDFEPWSFGFEFQLPVGELQSTQKLSPRPTPVPVQTPRAAVSRGPDDRVRVDPPASEGARSEVATGPSAAGRATEGRTVPAGEGAEAPSGPAKGDEAPSEGRPVSPLAAAGAAAGAAALSLLGAGWMLASSGVRPGDLLGAPPADDFEPPAPAAPASRDGDVHPETGDVWSEPDRGWVSQNLYELDRGARRAEVERAEAVSRDESRRESAEVDGDLRASEARQREAAGTEAEAARVFELESSFQPEKIEPYQPGWSDTVAWGLEQAEGWADSGVSLLGEITGTPGKLGGKIYTLTKETVKGTSEGVAAYARGQGGMVAAEGSAWIIAERAGIGLAKGGAKLGLDHAAGNLIERAGRLAGRPLPELPDLSDARLVSVVREVASGAQSATRQAVGIAAGKTGASQDLQKPANRAVEAVTGEKL